MGDTEQRIMLKIMTKIESYKEQTGARDFIEEFESSISEFIEGCAEKGYLNIVFAEYQINRLVKLIESSNSAKKLYNNIVDIIDTDDDQIRLRINKLKDMGIFLDKGQFGTIICHNYQVTAERLKLHLVTLIDFEEIGIEKAHKKPLGTLLKKLQYEFPENIFIMKLNTRIRNAVTHYSYYFEKEGRLCLCDGYFDPSPQKMNLNDFVKESKQLHILTESLFLIFQDKYYPGGKLKVGRN